MCEKFPPGIFFSVRKSPFISLFNRTWEMLGVFYERESAGVFGQYFENCLSSVVERLR